MLDTLIQMRNEYNAALRQLQEHIRNNTEIQTQFAQQFAWFFESHPDVSKLSFTGSIPYFNDGEPCVFGLGEVEIPEPGPFESEDWTGWVEDNEHLNGDLCKIANFLVSELGEETLQFIFGNNFRVIIHRNGTLETEDYSCGH